MGHVYMEHRKCSDMGWSFGIMKCQLVACMEYRKCSGMGGVSVTGHVSAWYV